MPTIELTLQRKTDSGYPVVAALTRPGEFLPLRREGLLTLDIAALPELQFEPLAYGTALGQALFVDEIRDTFVKALGDEPLRVLLSVEASDLRALDWYRLAAPFDGRWCFLASQQNTPFSLSIPSPASANFPAIGHRDLRALVLVAGPESLSGDYKLGPFDIPATIAGIQSALGNIPFDILPNPSLDALCAALTATPYTLLHLVCHGAVNQNGETILYFPKDERRTPTPASDLLNRLGSLAHLPHFVFLAACESALPQNGLGSLAGRLVRELGLPAVLAMTDRVSIATARAIAAPFYAHLYEHGQPDLALAQSLAGLQGAHDLTVPAIFSRLGDRPLFDDNSERALTEKELEFGLVTLAESLPERAPVMDSLRDTLTRRLLSTLGADAKSLSETRRTERKETLDKLISLSLETLDLSFNALCLGQTLPAYDSCSPFRGLESFRPEDAAYFFGREALTRKLVQKLNEHNFLAVLGASGSGKSSLVMAGLIPALNVPYAMFRPGAEPLAELEKALQADPQLLVVDQFEELFTLSAKEQRAEFISRLLEQSDRLRVVITLRADFLGEVAPFKLLKDEVQNYQEIIPPMDEAELRRAMEGQAGCAGLRFESDLSQQMLDDVLGEPGAMPLLQYALWTLWTRRHGRWLRADEYRAFGGVRQAIASTAEAVFARCTDFEKERLRDIFLRLTRLDEGADGRDTRRRVLFRDLIPADSDPAATTLFIKQLADARLLVVTGDEVEVAHEALIRHWERLRAWLNDDRDNLRLREGVSDDARRWENAARDESLFNHRGARLELALEMSKNPRYRLNPVEQTYLDGCVELREREIKAKETLRRRIMTGLATGLIVALILAGFAVYQMLQAQNQARAARGGELATQSYLVKDTWRQRSILLAMESVRTANGLPHSKSIFPEQALYDSLLDTGGFPLPGHEGYTYALAFSSDGHWLATGGNDKVIRLWNMQNPSATPLILYGRESSIHALAFSPDGKWLVAGGNYSYGYGADNTVHIWRMQDLSMTPITLRGSDGIPINKLVFSPDGHWLATVSGGARLWNMQNLSAVPIVLNGDEGVLTLAFSPDGRWLVTGNGDKTAQMWDMQNLSTAPIVLRGHENNVSNLAFNSDGRWLATVTSYTTYLWDMKDLSAPPITLSGHEYGITAVAFSPNGRWLATGSFDKTARLWDTQNSFATPIVLRGHEGDVKTLAFSSDGRWLATGSDDKTLRLWNMQNLSVPPIVLHGDENGIYVMAFSPDGRWLVTGGDTRLWDIYNPSVDPIILRGHNEYIRALAFSPDGHWLATCSDDKTARLWNMQNLSAIPAILSGHEDIVTNLAFSTTGRWLATISNDKTARLWDIQNPAAIPIVLRGHEESVNVLSFSPDGRYLATGSNDKTVHLWNMMNFSAAPIVLRGHEDGIVVLAFSPSGRYLATGSNDKIVRLWDMMNFSATPIALRGHDEGITVLAFSPDERYLATGSNDKTVRLWDIRNFSTTPIILREHKGGINVLAFSPDGRWLATGGGDIFSVDNTVRLWNMENLSAAPFILRGHQRSISVLGFSPDSHWLATGSGDIFAEEKIVYLWDMQNPSNAPLSLRGNESGITALSFSPDRQRLAISSGNITPNETAIRLWDLNIETLVQTACQVAGRNFTRTEWAQYFPDESYPIKQDDATCPQWPLEPEPTATPTP